MVATLAEMKGGQLLESFITAILSLEQQNENKNTIRYFFLPPRSLT